MVYFYLHYLHVHIIILNEGKSEKEFKAGTLRQELKESHGAVAYWLAAFALPSPLSYST